MVPWRLSATVDQYLLPVPSGVLCTKLGSIFTVAASCVLFERPLRISVLIRDFT